MATNNSMTGSYCLSKKVNTSHHIIFITVCAENVRLQHERKRIDGCWCHSTLSHSITVWLRAAHSLMMHCFSSSTSRDLGTIGLLLINAKEVTVNVPTTTSAFHKVV